MGKSDDGSLSIHAIVHNFKDEALDESVKRGAGLLDECSEMDEGTMDQTSESNVLFVDGVAVMVNVYDGLQ